MVYIKNSFWNKRSRARVKKSYFHLERFVSEIKQLNDLGHHKITLRRSIRSLIEKDSNGHLLFLVDEDKYPTNWWLICAKCKYNFYMDLFFEGAGNQHNYTCSEYIMKKALE